MAKDLIAPTAVEYISKARELHEEEGTLEIDHVLQADQEDAISRSEDQTGEIGAYVKAWVWVPREAIQAEFES